jgi:uncharacterized protein (DUF2236 family)
VRLTLLPPNPIAPLRQVVLRPVRAAFGSDRFAEEQYTDPVGDPGLFGPDSVTWRVHADASMLIGGVSAVILQTIHPLAIAGVTDHSQWRERPFQRLSRTSSFVTATTYGATPVAEKIIDIVKAVHTRVVGTAPDGRPYRADDPDLLRWIHVGEVSSFLHAHQRFSLLPISAADQDRYYDEVRIVAERLGATDVPASRAQVAAYFAAVRPELVAGPQALETVRYLLVPPFRERSLQVAYGVIMQAAIALLPDWARVMLGLDDQNLRQLATARPAAIALLNVMRLAGGTPPAVRQARARCAGAAVTPARVRDSGTTGP